MARSDEEVEKQAADYRAKAEVARQEARNAGSPTTKEEFLKIAEGWLRMAAEVEERRFH